MRYYSILEYAKLRWFKAALVLSAGAALAYLWHGPPSKGGAACVRACPTGAAIRVSPEQFLNYAGPME